MSKIKNVYAREILDSRGNPTVEVDVVLENGIIGRAAVPSGASTGIREAIELRDKDYTRYNGLGVLTAVNNVNKELKNLVVGMDSNDQEKIDYAMIKLDGTKNKARLGANAILGVSMAVLVANAKAAGKPLYKFVGEGKTLPVPMMNIINGGAHADNNLDFQEYMIIPNRDTIKERVRVGSEVFHALKKILKENGYSTGVGDEGGYAPSSLANGSGPLEELKNEGPLELMKEAVEAAGFKLGEDICFAMDLASSEFYNPETGKYELSKSGQGEKTSDEMIDMIEEWTKKYPLISIEDGLAENDWDGWKKLTERLGDKVQLVGDDLFVTNTTFIKKGIELGVANSILIKLNQIGTLTETFDAIEMAKKHGYTCIVSHRSGETEDTTIADIAVGLNAGQIKTGSLSRTDRIAKYNRLMRIEDELNQRGTVNVAEYLGDKTFYNLPAVEFKK